MIRLSIKTKMAFAVSAVFILFGAATSSFALKYFERAYKVRVANDLTLLAIALGESIDTKLETARNGLEAAAASLPPAVMSDPDRAQRYLDERITLQSIFPREILLVSGSGALLAEYPSHRNRRGADLSDRDFFTAAITGGKPLISTPSPSKLKETGFDIHIAVPIPGEQGGVAAVMAGSFDLLHNAPMEEVLRTRIGNRGHLCVFGRDGSYLIHQGEQIRMESELRSPNPLFDRALAGGEATGESLDCNGTPVLTSFRQLRMADWLVAVNYPLSEAYAPLEMAKRCFFGAMLLGTLAVLLIVWLLTKRFTDPILGISRHVQALTRLSSEEKPLGLNRGDEIGILARAFDHMVATVERQKAELRIEVEKSGNEKARSEAIIAAIGEGLSIQDREFRVLYQNQVHKQLIGDHPGEHCYRVYEGKSEVCSDCPVAMAFEDGAIHTIEKTNWTNGGKKHLAITASPLRNPSGEIVAGIEIVRDITGRKLAEAEILNLNRDLNQRAAELAAANREMEAFSYSLTHDLKTPLTGIYASAQALAEDHADSLDENGRFFVDNICRASERMEELLDAMLLLCRITQSEIQREPVDLSELAKEVLSRLCLEEPGRRVEWTIAPDAKATGDPRLLKSVMENLLGNAWKYTRHKPLAQIEFGLDEHEGKGGFFVRDNGAGFPMKDADRLFIPFQRLHSGGEFEGTGIGLATVQRIIRRHGGQIRAVGEPQAGATFFFTL